MALHCARCGHEYPDRKRGSESEALMFRVMDAVATGPSEKVYFCDEKCYRETSDYAQREHQRKKRREHEREHARKAAAAKNKSRAPNVDDGEESGSEALEEA